MNETIKKKSTGTPTAPLANEKELMSLVELQKFLADELSDAQEEFQFGKAFLPITDGLGLEKPKSGVGVLHPTNLSQSKKEPQLEPQPQPIPVFRAPTPQAPLAPSFSNIFEGNERGERPAAASNTKSLFQDTTATPPPVPSPGGFQSVFAALLDLVFVGVMWSIFIFLSVRLTHRGNFNMPGDLFQKFTEKPFLRMAFIEYAAIWICYLTVCYGIIERTFGMWVWGFKVSYGEESHFLRKLLRVAWAAIFYIPVIGVFVLWFRVKGKDLLDFLSNSRLYLTLTDE